MADFQSRAGTAAGTQLFIADGLPTTFDQAGYEALSYIKIGEVMEIPEFGKEYTIINHNPLDSRKTFKRKGSYDEGAIAFPYAVAMGPGVDEGQALLLQALNVDRSYAFKMQFNDDPDDGANSAPTVKYFPGQVASAKVNPGSVDSIIIGTTNVAIDGDILHIQAVEHAA